MGMELTWLGHATWLLKSGTHTILIDPFLRDNPVATVKPEEIDAEFVLITHGHFDHVADAAEIANRCGAQLIANYEIADWFAKKHAVKNTLGMNLGGSVKLPFGKLTMTLAWHSSGLPDGCYGGSPSGYIIETGGKRLYFAGDTAFFGDMQLIGQGGLDLAVLPIGDVFTMGPEDSVRAAELLKPKKVMPTHYNTWPPIAQDAKAWAEVLRFKAGVEVVVPELNFTVALEC